ncbi:MAG: response regulator [Fuerstiella sp.]
MNDSNFNVLIIDDEPNIRSGLAKGLRGAAHTVDTAGTANEALFLFAKSDYQLVIVDVRLNCEINGIDLARKMLFARPETAIIVIIVITAHGTVETAVEAMRAGAFDFVAKPLDLNLVRQQVRKAREHYLLKLENRRLRSQLANAGEISNIIGNCTVIQNVYHQIRQVAATQAT